MDASPTRRRITGVCVSALALLTIILPSPAGATGATTSRVSVSSTRDQGNGGSFDEAISADGRFVAFDSSASNLVPGDTNRKSDVFVRNRTSHTTTRVSVSSSGHQGNRLSQSPAISADGTFVAFWSDASNLVPGDTNEVPDVFVRDLTTDTTTRVSESSTGDQGNGRSFGQAISADGMVVAFQSDASNLVPDDTNESMDVFVRDLTTDTTTRVSESSTGDQGDSQSLSPAISADGMVVAFQSDASNLVPGDTNPKNDVFVRDLTTDTTTRVSVSSTGHQGNGNSFDAAISTDGRFVAFASYSSNLITTDTNRQQDVFVRDRTTDTTTRVSLSFSGHQGTRSSYEPAISGDGRFVAFGSKASNLVTGDTNRQQDMFVRDRTTHTTTRVSVSSTGHQGNGDSYNPVISGDGRFVAFGSGASNLVKGDTNGSSDVFLRGPLS